MRVGFVLDLGRCVGCDACVIACRLEHGWPAESPRRRVVALNHARHPAGPTYFLSLACHHCEHPVCLEGCPTGAYEQRADGVVLHDDRLCIGCRHCEMACPFGAPRFDSGRGVVAKCDFCRARVDGGDPPACVAACPTDALQAAWNDRAEPGAPSLESDAAEGVDRVPGFSDPTGCKPAIRFKMPQGIRGQRLAGMVRGIAARLGVPAKPR